jgi:cell division protein FtsB
MIEPCHDIAHLGQVELLTPALEQSLAFFIAAAVVATGIVAQCAVAQADKLDLILQRLDALEQSNAKLAKENAALRERLNRVETTKGGCN